jgi:hypothetical protein
VQRGTWSGVGVLTVTPGWRGCRRSASSTVTAGGWAEADSPNPAHKVTPANTRIVSRLIPIRGFLLNAAREVARGAWIDRLECLRHPAEMG